ncbi:unnamed protein product [marine sediment metagenome]|uniref:Uncharacterized protein n=1 Tax=marine sediment metagenome TaxID=412755 RepID=X1IW08_9ZZZZ
MRIWLWILAIIIGIVLIIDIIKTYCRKQYWIDYLKDAEEEAERDWQEFLKKEKEVK